MKNANFITKELRLDGNHLCLNFINTIYDRHTNKYGDLIESSEDWLAWLKRVSLIDDNTLLEKNMGFDLQSLVETRELFYRVFRALYLKESVLKKDIWLFEKLILKVQKFTKLSVIEGQPAQKLMIENNHLNNYLLPIIKSAYELFVSDKIDRIKECGHCGWLYLDISKNNSRKWCSMSSCGSQIKAKRYYQNKKKNVTS